MLYSALVLVLAVPGLAQSSSGKIVGTVRTTGGNPAVGATVIVTNQQTKVSRVVRATVEGAYEAADLPQGLYSVSAALQGFRKVTLDDQRLEAGGTLTVDLTLEVRVSESVTISAMKREETIKDTPFSVAAPTQETLRERGVDSLEGVAANVANFSYQNLGPGQNQVAMRGVSSGQIARDQPGVKESVGSYLDESVVSLSLFTPDLDLFDMNRVEVLRGPQGTLFGSGSLSGTIRYITNQPELGVTRYFGEFAANGMTGGDAGGYAKVGFNAPLGGMAAVRVVGYYDRFSGWTDAIQPDLSIKRNVNNGDHIGLRAAVEMAPIEGLTITPRFVYQDVSMNGWNREDIYNILANPFTTTRPAVTFRPLQEFTQINEPYSDKFYLGDLNIKYDLGGNVSLTSITSYTHRDILVVRDATQLTASYTGASAGFPESVYTLSSPLNDATQAHAWTEELRLSGGDGRFKWVAGSFFADNTRHYGQNLSVPGFEEMTGIPNQGLLAPKDSLFFSDLNYKLRQWALFGEGTYTFGDRWAFTGGLRYYNFHEDKAQIFDSILGNTVSNSGTTKADGVSPRFILTYKVSADTSIDAQVSKGFRLGGINDPINGPLCSPQDLITFGGRDTWRDETAWNYEVGVKSNILGGRGTFGLSAFYEDLHDLQVTVTAGTCSSRLIFNVPHARSVGGELEFAAALNDNFDLSFSAGYADAQLRSTVTSTAPDGTVSVVSGIQTGERLPGVPKFQANVALTYQQPVMEGFIGYATAVYQHVGDRTTQVGDDLPGFGVVNLLNPEIPHTIGGPLTQTTLFFNPVLPAYDIINLRLGVRHGNFDVALFVNNLTDERALLALDRERGFLARVGYLTNAPRTIGLTSRVDF